MTSHISELVTSKKKLVTTSNKLTSLDIQIRALGIASGLTVTEEGNDLTGWYCKAYIAMGEGKYSAIASMARKGNKPKSLFGWLLKQEMSKNS
jgi:hypothetical protein